MTTQPSQLPVGNDVDTQPYLAISSPPIAYPARVRLGGANDVNEQLSDIRGEDREHFVVFDLNVRHGVIARRTVHIGTLTGVEVHPREIFKGAILNSAAAVIVCHNHPSGDPTPSRADIEMTGRIREVGEVCGIPLLDHVVVAPNGYVSLAERNWR
jgi:DNA repair protein RadC